MKKILACAFALQSGLAFATTPPAIVEGLDNAREGDLAAKVAAYFEQSPMAPKCEEYQTSRTVAFKVVSGSSHEEKVPGTKAVFDAQYLVMKFCFSGSTFVGAYREPKVAFLVAAHRRGVENAKNVIVPSEADQIQIVKQVNLSSIQVLPN